MVHDISQRSKLFHIEAAHKGKVSGVCFADEHRLLSCGVDRNIQLWDTREVDENGAGPSQACVTLIFASFLVYLLVLAA